MSSITEILSELGIDFARAGEHHHVREGWIGVNCPWCPPSGEKGKYKLGIEVNSGRTNCWSCGRHSLQSVIVETARIPFRAAKDLLKGVRVVRFRSSSTYKKAAGKLIKPKGVGPLTQAHINYLRHRDFDPVEIERLWNVQGISLAARLQWRLYIPIQMDGQEVSWTTRSISDNQSRRYISAQPSEEMFHLKESVYGVDLVRSTIVVVEGPTDAWRIGPGAVAIFGLNYTRDQIELIARFPHRIICLDNEETAQKVANRLYDTLSLMSGKTTILCLDAADPGTASRKEISRLRAVAFGRE